MRDSGARFETVFRRDTLANSAFRANLGVKCERVTSKRNANKQRSPRSQTALSTLTNGVAFVHTHHSANHLPPLHSPMNGSRTKSVAPSPKPLSSPNGFPNAVMLPTSVPMLLLTHPM